MRKFKLERGNKEVYELTKDQYLNLTKKDRNYHYTGDDGKRRDFAICPACDNPIQIVGLYKELKNTDRPYGKHYNHDTRIAKHNEKIYSFCPYASNRYQVGKDDRKDELTDFECDIYNTLRENADFAYYIIKQDTGIRFTRNRFIEMLNSFKSREGHMYYWATLYNIPWMLLYLNTAVNCFGLQVRKDSILYGKLSELDHVKFEYVDDFYVSVKNKEDKFLDLRFATTAHDRKVVNDELVESVTLDFYKRAESGSEPFKTLFTIKLPINESRFLNLIHSEKAQKYRNPEILKITQEIFPELK